MKSLEKGDKLEQIEALIRSRNAKLNDGEVDTATLYARLETIQQELAELQKENRNLTVML